MKGMVKKLVLLALVLFLVIQVIPVRADELSDVEKELAEVKALLDESKKASEPLEANLTLVREKINTATIQIAQKEKEITLGEKDLVKQKQIINERARNYYKQSRRFLGNMLGVVLSKNLPEAMRAYFYQQQGLQRDRDTIIKTAFLINKLEEDHAKLGFLKQQLEEQRSYFETEVAKAKDYQSGLEGKISELVARQQQLIAQKLASLNIPQSAYAGIGSGCSSDLTNGKSPGFSPAFGFFTYGVPNRVGLNQYGAKGRAEAGQSAEDILRNYYNAEYTQGYSTDINIHVVGSNEYGQSFDENWSIEEYLKHVYEMPTNWPGEALKAQAIAARSYALAYTNNGSGSICPSQSCQVVKQEENTDTWKQAVSDTAGIVLTNGGQPIKAWFSSTHGGFVLASGDIGWSATSWTKSGPDTNGAANSFGDLLNNAYDKDSPWFYCDWGSRSQYSNTAWLKSDEVADIVNVSLLAASDGSLINHLWQIDKDNPYGTDTWDSNRVKQELRARGITPYDSVSSITAGFSTWATTSITVNGNQLGVSGAQFKIAFNSRAPENIQIVGPLYNVEQQ